MTVWTILIVMTIAALWWGFNEAESHLNFITIMRTLGSFLFVYFIVLIVWFVYALGLLRAWW